MKLHLNCVSHNWGHKNIPAFQLVSPHKSGQSTMKPSPRIQIPNLRAIFLSCFPKAHFIPPAQRPGSKIGAIFSVLSNFYAQNNLKGLNKTLKLRRSVDPKTYPPKKSNLSRYDWKPHNLENKLLLISINFTPKTSHSCLKKWYTMFSRKV